jgi:beta-glucosidase
VTSPSEGKEAVDRKAITLPPGQEEFIRKVQEANSDTIVVLISSFPVALPWAAENVPTILHMTHASQELGNALGDVLFGEVDPGGRLVQTWPKSVEQLPPMMDYDIRHGRTYMYFEGEPQYAFGHGLSCTSFQYGNIQISANQISPTESVDVEVDITNTGKRAGDEIVQLYVRRPDSKIARPLKELRGFRRISLASGESTSVMLTLDAASLSHWDIEKEAWVVEPGSVEVLVGRSSRDTDLVLRKTFQVSGW